MVSCRNHKVWLKLLSSRHDSRHWCAQDCMHVKFECLKFMVGITYLISWTRLLASPPPRSTDPVFLWYCTIWVQEDIGGASRSRTLWWLFQHAVYSVDFWTGQVGPAEQVALRGSRQWHPTPPSPVVSMRRSRSRCLHPSAPQCGNSSPWMLLVGGGWWRRRLEHGFPQHHKLLGRTFSFLLIT
jgi:hypothetical protein